MHSADDGAVLPLQLTVRVHHELQGAGSSQPDVSPHHTHTHTQQRPLPSACSWRSGPAGRCRGWRSGAPRHSRPAPWAARPGRGRTTEFRCRPWPTRTGTPSEEDSAGYTRRAVRRSDTDRQQGAPMRQKQTRVILKLPEFQVWFSDVPQGGAQREEKYMCDAALRRDYYNNGKVRNKSSSTPLWPDGGASSG